MKFKTQNKCIITSRFSDNSSYRPWTHTGIDWSCGYGTTIYADNPGVVYKIFDKDSEGSDGWRGVYLLTPYKDHYVEVIYGHCKDVFVGVGDKVSENQAIATEGNFGKVFSGGVQITPEMRSSGDKRGSHCHESYRPVRRVKKIDRKEHYLNTISGRKYRDPDGYYYEIVYKNNTKGCIDPMMFEVDGKDILVDALKKQFEETKSTPTKENKVTLYKLWIAVLKIFDK